MKQLGVIGGLGPIATAYFMDLIIQMTDAKTDQEHMQMIIYSSPQIPDRTAYILGKSQESPGPLMIEIGKNLGSQRVDNIAIPCITAHYFHEELQREIGIPIIHLPQVVAKYLAEHSIGKVGIMATDGTVQSKLFQKELEHAGLEAVIPSQEKQKYVMDLIYENVKAGLPADMEKFQDVSEELRGNGAEIIILGCTELSLIKRDEEIGSGYLDAMEVLAQEAILRSEAPLKKSFQELISR